MEYGKEKNIFFTMLLKLGEIDAHIVHKFTNLYAWLFLLLSHNSKYRISGAVGSQIYIFYMYDYFFYCHLQEILPLVVTVTYNYKHGHSLFYHLTGNTAFSSGSNYRALIYKSYMGRYLCLCLLIDEVRCKCFTQTY